MSPVLNAVGRPAVHHSRQVPLLALDRRNRSEQKTTARLTTTLRIDDAAPGTSGPGFATANVKNFGAIGDGVKMDTAAVQAAIDSVRAAGGVVYFPPGTYLLGNVKITDAANVTITGPGAKINWTGVPAGTGDIGFQYSGNITNLTICDLVMNGDGVVAHRHAGVWGFSGQTLNDIKILRNHITNVVVGISLDADLAGSITGGLIEGNYLDNIVGTQPGQGYGIHHANGSGSASSLRILNNSISRAHRHAIYQAKGSGVVIEGNTIRQHRMDEPYAGSQRPAINIARSSHIVCSSNVITEPNDCAISVAGDAVAGIPCSDVLVTDNIVSNPASKCPFSAIIVGDISPTPAVTEQVSLLNNHVSMSGSAAQAITIYSGFRVNVAGNQLYCVDVPSKTAAIQIRGIRETAGTANYTDDLMFKDNFVYGTRGNGGRLSGFAFHTTAATSTIRADFVNNRISVPDDVFTFGEKPTNPNIRVSGTPTTGLDMSLVKPVDGAAVPSLLPQSRAVSVQEGTAVLVNGTVTIANSQVKANSRIFLTSQTDGGTPGFLRVSVRKSGVGFTITSSSPLDTSTVAWMISQPTQ